jgi:hypothetical protein
MGASVPFPLAKKSHTHRSRTTAPATARRLAPTDERVHSGTRSRSSLRRVLKGTWPATVPGSSTTKKIALRARRNRMAKGKGTA